MRRKMLRPWIGEVDHERFEADDAGRGFGFLLLRGIARCRRGGFAEGKKCGGSPAAKQQDEDAENEDEFALRRFLFRGRAGWIGRC